MLQMTTDIAMGFNQMKPPDRTICVAVYLSAAFDTVCHNNLHTHAVDSSIQLQGNNGVLKERPPPISDEEQRLNRRQRCTLSQLLSGHCHLLQDYKHRVLGEPSDICTDCGASPQDVIHLFACTTRPTDLSPEDL